MEWRIWITWWIVFCIRYARLFWINLEKNGEKTPSIRIDINKIQVYVNKIENKITFKIKTGSYLELLTPETC